MIYTDGVHLVADTLDELHMFAAAMGLRHSWFQDHPRHPHYDLTTKRAANRALAQGAILVTTRQLVRPQKGVQYDPRSYTQATLD